MKKKEQVIVPFDPKKRFRGDFGHLKTVKGGFKAEKLEKKKFELDTINNPFAMGDDFEKEENEDAEEVPPANEE